MEFCTGSIWKFSSRALYFPNLTFYSRLHPCKAFSSSGRLFLRADFPSCWPRNAMSWSCRCCTFLNPSSSKASPICDICLSTKSPSPASSKDTPQWSCKACTFLNHYRNEHCEICGTRATASSLSYVDNLDWDESVGSVFLPLRSIRNKRKEKEPAETSVAAECDSSDDPTELDVKRPKLEDDSLMEEDEKGSGYKSSVFKILTYNVWFREDLEIQQRMEAIGDLILEHSPDMMCFQEVTTLIYEIFQKSWWWKRYNCSVSHETASTRSYFCMQLSRSPVKTFRTIPFQNSGMGRELCIAELDINGRPLVVSTSHLESPSPGPPKWDQMFSKERVEQARVAVNHLNSNPNVIFCGDMNWDDKLDGQFPLPDGWIDAWSELMPGDNGWTYDTKQNKMLSGNRSLQKRLDRFLCRMKDFKNSSIRMIGKEAIPGLSYVKEKKVRNGMKSIELPVLPSDHYGLLLTITDNREC